MTTINNFSKTLKKALEETLKEISSPRNMQSIGNELRDDIVKRTRLGYGTSSNGGQRTRFDKLSDSYVLQRRGKLGFWTNSKGKVIPINVVTDKELDSFRASESTRKQVINNRRFLRENKIKLATTTSAKKSNLTQTGDMLSRIGVLVGVARARIGFKTSKAARKASFVSKRRPFMFATRQQINRLSRSVRKRLNSIIDRKIKF